MSRAFAGTVLLCCLAAVTAAVPASAATRSSAVMSGQSAVPAQRHAQSWHVVDRLAGADITSLAAAGPGSAWAAGNTEDRKGVPHGILVRWDGSRWRPVAYPDHGSQLIYSIFALSRTDAWFYAADSGNGKTEMLHWVDGRWSTMALPVNGQNVDVISDSDIWLEGGVLPGCYTRSQDSVGCTITSHWNGKAWTSYPLRAVNLDSFGSSSGANVWAVADSWEREKSLGPGRGFIGSMRPAVYRWTGTSWRSVAVTLPRSGSAPLIVVRSPRDVYVADSTGAARRACAIHWNGSRWTPFYLPGSPGACMWTISDYHRGLWFIGPFGPGFSWVHWTGARFVTTPEYVPNNNGWETNGFTIAAVPHSTSVWLSGSYCAPNGVCKLTGVIATLR